MLGLMVFCGALALVAELNHRVSPISVPEIPAYPGARDFQRTTGKDSVYGRFRESLTFETDDDRPVVVKFYSDYLLSHGWYTPPGCEGWQYFYGKDRPPYAAMFPYEQPNPGHSTRVVIFTNWGMIPCDLVRAPHSPDPKRTGPLIAILPSR